MRRVMIGSAVSSHLNPPRTSPNETPKLADRDRPWVTFALLLAAGARLRLVAFARVKQTACDHLKGRSYRVLACDHCIRSRPPLNGRWRKDRKVSVATCKSIKADLAVSHRGEFAAQ
jgi:hypothetical protein